MRTFSGSWSWCCRVSCVLSGPAFAAGDAAKGKAAYAKCAICHQVGPNAQNAVGPELNGIVGRKAASVADFAYSPGHEEARRGGLRLDRGEHRQVDRRSEGDDPGFADGAQLFQGIPDAQRAGRHHRLSEDALTRPLKARASFRRRRSVAGWRPRAAWAARARAQLPLCPGAEFLDVVEDRLEEIVPVALLLGDLAPGRAQGGKHVVRPLLDANAALGVRLARASACSRALSASVALQASRGTRRRSGRAADRTARPSDPC